jgi:hypothetical protein
VKDGSLCTVIIGGSAIGPDSPKTPVLIRLNGAGGICEGIALGNATVGVELSNVGSMCRRWRVGQFEQIGSTVTTMISKLSTEANLIQENGTIVTHP